ncbi:hypothetical protein D3C80_1676090 [compost metagenome]
MTTRSAAMVRSVTHGGGDFGGDHDIPARHTKVLQRAPQYFFAASVRIDICCIEQVYAGVESGLDQCIGILLVKSPHFSP